MKRLVFQGSVLVLRFSGWHAFLFSGFQAFNRLVFQVGVFVSRFSDSRACFQFFVRSGAWFSGCRLGFQVLRFASLFSGFQAFRRRVFQDGMPVFRFSGLHAGFHDFGGSGAWLSGWHVGFQVFRFARSHSGFQIFGRSGNGFFRLACWFSDFHVFLLVSGFRAFRRLASGWRVGFQLLRFAFWLSCFQAFRCLVFQVGTLVFRFSGLRSRCQAFGHSGALFFRLARWFSGFHVFMFAASRVSYFPVINLCFH